jgi:hypothetical protein
MTRTNFKFENENITMVKGDTLAFNVQVFDEEGEPFAVDMAEFTCKKIATSPEYLFKKTLGDGITQENMLMTVRVAPEDTREAESGEYFYDMNIGVGDDIYTLKLGLLSILQDVSY